MNQPFDIQTVIARRLEDMADQVNQLYTQGLNEEAELLRQEGLSLAQAYDQEENFLYIPDWQLL